MKDADDDEAVDLMIDFMYGKEVMTDDVAMLCRLLTVADRFMIQLLSDLVEAALKDWFDRQVWRGSCWNSVGFIYKLPNHITTDIREHLASTSAMVLAQLILIPEFMLAMAASLRMRADLFAAMKVQERRIFCGECTKDQEDQEDLKDFCIRCGCRIDHS